jgi:mRNA-degrading endonuclease RelE of RelBE toxin-antitoxin system
MMRVLLSAEAQREAAELPRVVRVRLIGVVRRLEHWPDVSGAKPLRGKLAGRYRIRTGDYRVQFRVKGDTIIVERVGHRDRFYEE